MLQPPNSDIRAGAWGLTAGLVGSLCCIGPSAAILLGLGSSSALLGLSLDRRLALAGGAALLRSGLALAVRRTRACDLRLAARWRAPALMIASFGVAYGLLGVLAPTLATHREDAVADPVRVEPQHQGLGLSKETGGVSAAPLRHLTLSVEKMDCPPCAAHIRALLRRTSSLQGFFAEASIDQVTIDYDSSQISAQKLIALFPPHFGVTLLDDQVIR